MELDVFARKMFDDMSMRILVSWNTMNQGYALPCSFMAGLPCIVTVFFLFATMFN